MSKQEARRRGERERREGEAIGRDEREGREKKDWGARGGRYSCSDTNLIKGHL